MASAPARLEVLRHGTLYRAATGPQGYYARVLQLDSREFLASVILSEAIESPDSHPELLRSTDGGNTWRLEGPLDPAQVAPGHATETGFISQAPDGSLLCLGARFPLDPADPTRPLVHPKTIGMAPNELVLRRSRDKGRTWTPPVGVPKPYPVPIELPTGLATMADGTLLLACSTWREWSGASPFGHRITLMRSFDGGTTWKGPSDIFHDPTNTLGFWEGRVIQLSGPTLMATCWAHDWKTDQDANNHFAFSRDGGASWAGQAVSPVTGQTGWPLRLEDDRILFVYNHRRPPVGVRAQIATVAPGRWTTVYDTEVWTPEDRRTGVIRRDDYAVTHFQFGQPSAIRVNDQTVLVVYWCVENGRAGINGTWIRLAP